MCEDTEWDENNNNTREEAFFAFQGKGTKGTIKRPTCAAVRLNGAVPLTRAHMIELDFFRCFDRTITPGHNLSLARSTATPYKALL